METDIAYIVSHGFASRMVAQTNLLGRLVQSGLSIALIAPDKEDQNLKKYCEANGINLFEFSPKSAFWTSKYENSRKYFLENIDANTALLEKHIWATKYNKSKNPWHQISPRILYVVHRLKNYFPLIKKWYKKREEKYLISLDAQQLIENINPKILVSTYPVNFSESMLLKAGNQSISVKTVIHLLSWDNISCKGHFPQLANEYIAWGPIMKQEFIEYYGINENNIHVCGVPHFDLHIQTKKKPDNKHYVQDLGLDPNKPYLFFGMSSPRFAPKEIDIIEWLVDKINNGCFGGNMQLIIRPHPQNVQGTMADLSWITRLEKISTKKVAVYFPNLVISKLPWSMQQDDMIKLSHILEGAALSLNSGSTLSIEALICNKPVILTSFDGNDSLNYWQSAKRLTDYPHIKKLIKIGGISVVKNYNELEKCIKNYINDPEFEAKARENCVFQECGINDGKATERVINSFLKIIGK